MGDTLTPITREEHFLQAIADAYSQGGGSGGDSDNIPFRKITVTVKLIGTEGDQIIGYLQTTSTADGSILGLLEYDGKYFTQTGDILIETGTDAVIEPLLIVENEPLYLDARDSNYELLEPSSVEGDCEIISGDLGHVNITGDCTITFTTGTSE